MKLIIRPLKREDNKEEIFELCKQNDLKSAVYATNYDVWNFQYVNNPLKKSWNSVLVNKEDNAIYGHMGLVPQIIKLGSFDLLAGTLGNGVINASLRNKLLPFKKSKTFAITPLIDRCVNDSFNDNVDLCLVNSIIHPLIWRTLKFRTTNIEQKSTFHSSLRGLFKAYLELFRNIYKTSFIRFFALPYSIFLIIIQLITKIISKFSSVSNEIKTENLVFSRISQFTEDFNHFFNEFYDANPELITYKRDLNFLNWRFKSNHFLIYSLKVKNKLIGYIILKKQDDCKNDNNHIVLDCIILNDYLSYTSYIFKRLSKVENLRISFLHYLSCSYTHRLFKQCLKQGVLFTLNPLRILGIDKKKGHITSTLYYKINDKSKIAEEQKESFNQTNNWFITPILFHPSYYP